MSKAHSLDAKAPRAADCSKIPIRRTPLTSRFPDWQHSPMPQPSVP